MAFSKLFTLCLVALPKREPTSYTFFWRAIYSAQCMYIYVSIHLHPSCFTGVRGTANHFLSVRRDNILVHSRLYRICNVAAAVRVRRRVWQQTFGNRDRRKDDVLSAEVARRRRLPSVLLLGFVLIWWAPGTIAHCAVAKKEEEEDNLHNCSTDKLQSTLGHGKSLNNEMQFGITPPFRFPLSDEQNGVWPAGLRKN